MKYFDRIRAKVDVLIDRFLPMHFKTIIFGMYVSLLVNKIRLQLLSFGNVLDYAILYHFL